MKFLTLFSRSGGTLGSGRVVPGFVVVLLCALAVAPLHADDFDILRLEWRNFITGGTNLNLADPALSSRVTSAANTANNYWSSLNKAANRTNLWSDAASTTVSADITTCYGRLAAMAQGWSMVGSSLYGHTNLAADILGGLDWMYANRYSETKSEYNNWWDWEIGAPMALNNAMVMIYPLLSGTQITNYCNAIDHFSPAVTMTGANRIWKAEAVGVRGVVQKNAAKIAAARDGLSDVSGGGASSIFSYVTTSDGFYRDGSFIQHGKHPYTAGYGLYLFRDLAKMLVWLDGSPWTVTDPQRTNVVRWVYDSFEPLICLGALPEHLRGREISRSYTGWSSGQSAVNTIFRIAQTAPGPDAARMKSMVKYWAQANTLTGFTNYVDIDLVGTAEQLLADTNVVARGELIGHYQFPSMDRVMHLRPGFGFGLSLFSTRIYNYECINSENWHGWFTSSGMTYLWNSDLTQFTDVYWPTVDPYHLPGTTVDLTQLGNGANQSKASTQAWVGSAVLSNSFGVAGMALDDVNGPLVANKSWFLFDDEIVCLGAGISCTSTGAVHTTIENRRINGTGNNALTVNGIGMPTSLGWSSNLNGVTWCALDGAGGYFFPAGANLKALRQARTGKWSDINAGGSTTSYTRNYLTLWFDHGVAPTNAGYAYVLLPNASATAISQYAANPQVTILTNSAVVQAARENSLGLVAANFWTDATVSADFMTANRKAAVITRETNNVLEVAVSDPTQTNTGTINLTLNRAASGVLSADAGVTVLQLSPQVQLAVNVNGARGKTFQARLSLPSGIVAVADTVSTAAGTPVLVDVLANDIPAGQPLSLLSVQLPTNGITAIVGQLISYVSTAGFSGTDAFNYVVSDGTRSATGRVSATVGAPSLTILPAQVTASTNDGNLPVSTVDNDLNTRWSALGDGQWIQYDLLSTQLVDAVSIAFYSGATRIGYLDVLLSSDATNWTTAFAGQSSGTSTNLQRFDFADHWARYVRILGHGNSQSAWNSFTEVRVHAAPNSTPTALGDSAACLVGTPVLINVLANDFDPDAGPQPIFLASVSTPSHGTASLSDSNILYQSSPGYTGPDILNYVISDSGLRATGAVTVTITNLPSLPPTLAAISNRSLIAGATLIVTNHAVDSSAPPQRLLFSLASAPEGAAIDPATGVIVWRPAISQIGASNLVTVVVTQAGYQTNLLPLADAGVRDGASYSNANYGADTNLYVKLGSVAGSGLTRESFLRFALPAFYSNLTGARLQLTARTVSLPGTHAIALVTTDTWTEPAITWSNRPSSGPALATWAPVAKQVSEIALAAIAQSQMADGFLSLRIFATNTTADGLVSYGSREGDVASAPKLELVAAGPSHLSAPQSFWVAVTAPASPAIAWSGLTNGQFGLLLRGDVGPDYTIQAANSLDTPMDWFSLLVTNVQQMPFTWIDADTNARPRRFYRVSLGP